MQAAHGKLAEAFALAARTHASQTRKSTSIPYISHVMSVSALVLEFGGTPDQAIAALLHDALEDSPADQVPALRDTIGRQFGDHVLEMVEGCTDGVQNTDGVKPDWLPRKQAYLEHLRAAPVHTLLVSACDKLHNARAIVLDLRAGIPVFERFTATPSQTLWYYAQLVEAFKGKVPETLLRELALAVEEMHRLGAVRA